MYLRPKEESINVILLIKQTMYPLNNILIMIHVIISSRKINIVLSLSLPGVNSFRSVTYGTYLSGSFGKDFYCAFNSQLQANHFEETNQHPSPSPPFLHVC